MNLKQVLMAEDEPGTRMKYSALLKAKRPNIQLTTVESGEDLIHKAKDKRYDLIMTDNMMAGKVHGIQAIRDIRQFNREVPIYLICSFDNRSTILNQGMTAGATYTISKGSMTFIQEFDYMIKLHL